MDLMQKNQDKTEKGGPQLFPSVLCLLN